MLTILGIDPGSRFTGYGIIRSDGFRYQYIASGCIKVRGDDVSQKLVCVFHELHSVIQTYLPQESAIEQIFMAKNAQSALKLGQARGAAIVACAASLIPVEEYSAREVKSAVVGYGAADKSQVAMMVRTILKLTSTPQADEADALAIALCHANRRHTKNILAKHLAAKEGVK